MTGKQWIRLFKKHGWNTLKISSSHYLLNKGNLYEMIPHHTKDIGKKGEVKLRKKLKEGDLID